MLLFCPGCPRTVEIDKADQDPPAAASMMMVCPACDDGDFHSPEFFDEKGRWVHPLQRFEGEE